MTLSDLIFASLHTTLKFLETQPDFIGEAVAKQAYQYLTNHNGKIPYRLKIRGIKPSNLARSKVGFNNIFSGQKVVF